MQASDLLIKLATTSGSAGNSLAQVNPNNSLGKYIATTQLTDATLQNLFNDVTPEGNAASAARYRCLFIHNNHGSETLTGYKIWLQSETANGASIAIAIDSTAASAVGSASAQALQVADEDTAPSGLTFTSPTIAGTGLALGDIAAGYVKAVWVKITAANSAALNNDGVVLQIGAAPAYPSVDGAVRNNHTVWATCQAAATGTSVDTASTSNTVYADYYPPDLNYYIDRFFLSFPVDGGSVTSLSLRLMAALKSGGHSFQIFQGTQADTPTTADFDSFSGGALAEFDSDDMTVDQPYTVNFTSMPTVVDGKIKLCIRDKEFDVNNSAPPTGAGGDSTLQLYSVDHATAANRPLLSIGVTKDIDLRWNVANVSQYNVKQRIWNHDTDGDYLNAWTSAISLPNGDIIVMWSKGEVSSGSEADSSLKIVGKRSNTKGCTWGPLQTFLDTAVRADWNPAPILDGNRIYLFYVIAAASEVDTDPIDVKMVYSDDGLRTWSSPITFLTDASREPLHAGITMANGDRLLPVYHQASGICYIWRCPAASDATVAGNWTEYATAASTGVSEPTIVEIADNKVLMYARVNGTYNDGNAGWLRKITFDNANQTFGSWSNTTIVSLNCPAFVVGIDLDTHLIARNENNYAEPANRRQPLVYELTEDAGVTWGSSITIADNDDPAGVPQNEYPAIAAASFANYVISWNTKETAGWPWHSDVWVFPIVPLLAPTSLTAEMVAGDAVLDWVDNSSDETGFAVERSYTSASAGFSEIATVGAGIVTYTNIGPSLPAWYRVRAYNSIGYSAYSNVTTTVPGGKPLIDGFNSPLLRSVLVR